MSNKAYTLIEILVAVTIFSIVVGVVTTLFVSGVGAQRRSLVSQELLDQTSYVLEYMSRAIRMAKRELSAPACFSEDGLNYQIPQDYRKTGNLGRGVKFINYKGECQEFFWDWDEENQTGSKRLMESKNGGQATALTSDDLEITLFKIQLDGKEQDDEKQPRATLFLDIRGAGPKPEQQPVMKIQTTISQRKLDVPQ